MNNGEVASSSTGRRVLIVDDDRDALRILGDFLEAKGTEVVTAMDGHEALADIVVHFRDAIVAGGGGPVDAEPRRKPEVPEEVERVDEIDGADVQVQRIGVFPGVTGEQG